MVFPNKTEKILITPKQLQEALNYQYINGGLLNLTLVKLGFLTDIHQIPSLDLALFEIDNLNINDALRQLGQTHKVFPLFIFEKTLILAMSNPNDVILIDHFRFASGLQVEPFFAFQDAIDKTLEQLSSTSQNEFEDYYEPDTEEDDDEIFLPKNLITYQQLKDALDYQCINGGRFATALIKLGFLQNYEIPSIDLNSFELDYSTANLIPSCIAENRLALPLYQNQKTLVLAIADPSNFFALDDVRFSTGFEIEPIVASEKALRKAIKKYCCEIEFFYDFEKTYQPNKEEVFEAEEIFRTTDLESINFDSINIKEITLDDPETPPIIRFVNTILADAIRQGISEIFFESLNKTSYRVLFYLGSVLENVMYPPIKMRDPVTFYIKNIFKLDSSEKLLPQNELILTKLTLEDYSEETFCQVSCIPSSWGEKIIFKLLNKEKLTSTLIKLEAKFKNDVLLVENLLVEHLIDNQQLKSALSYQETNGDSLDSTLVKLGFLSYDQIASVLSKKCGIPLINLSLFKIDESITKLIPKEIARKCLVIPLYRVGKSLTLAMVDPTNTFAINLIKLITGFAIEPVIASKTAIKDVLEKYYDAIICDINEEEQNYSNNKHYSDDAETEPWINDLSSEDEKEWTN